MPAPRPGKISGLEICHVGFDTGRAGIVIHIECISENQGFMICVHDLCLVGEDMSLVVQFPRDMGGSL